MTIRYDRPQCHNCGFFSLSDGKFEKVKHFCLVAKHRTLPTWVKEPAEGPYIDADDSCDLHEPAED